MQYGIRSHDFRVTPGLRDRVDRRLQAALDRFAVRVERVDVTLSDINGPRGGADKRCQVDVKLKHLRQVQVGLTDRDLYAAIDRAMDRAHYLVGRELERAHTRRVGDKGRRAPTVRRPASDLPPLEPDGWSRRRTIADRKEGRP